MEVVRGLIQIKRRDKNETKDVKKRRQNRDIFTVAYAI